MVGAGRCAGTRAVDDDGGRGVTESTNPTQAVLDLRRDRTTLVRATALVASGYAGGAAIQSAYVYSQVMSEVMPLWGTVTIWQRLAANAIGVLALVLALAGLRLHRVRSPWLMAGILVVAAALCAGARALAQVLVGVYDTPRAGTTDAELFTGFVIGLISAGIGVWAMVARRRFRATTRAAEREAVHVELAVRALEAEEIRVRREVAEGLHGTLQGKLVLVDARLDEVVRSSSSLTAEERESIAWVRAELETARDIDVRQMSRLLYPERLELGLVPAVRALLGRIPASIATTLVASPEVRRIDDPASSHIDVASRLLAVRVVEEGVTNALKYGPATQISVDLDLVDGLLVVGVDNNGPSYDAGSAGAASGTARLADRLSLVGGTVSLRTGEQGGARLEARLPVASTD